MRIKNTSFVICAIVFGVSLVCAISVVIGLSGSVEELAQETIKGQANIILASANVNDKSPVVVPIVYYDQKMDQCTDLYSVGARAAASWRQFEWTKCGYQNFRIETELVEGELNSKYLPVALTGELVTNRGAAGENFERWFSQVDGKSKSYGGTLNLVYNEKEASFEYKNNHFYPLDEFTMGGNSSDGWVPKNESVNDDGHNHLFTLSLGIPIQILANGSEQFMIEADDDTWVFIDDRLAIDMGGIHEAEKAVFEIRSSGEVYVAVANEDMAYSGIALAEKDTAVIRVFHADRDSGTESSFSFRLINMVPNIVDAKLANSVGEIEVAYDPANPSYVAPLGESLTVRPNKSKALLTSVVIQGSMAGVFAILIMLSVMVGVRIVRRQKTRLLSSGIEIQNDKQQ